MKMIAVVDPPRAPGIVSCLDTGGIRFDCQKREDPSGLEVVEIRVPDTQYDRACRLMEKMEDEARVERSPQSDTVGIKKHKASLAKSKLTAFFQEWFFAWDIDHYPENGVLRFVMRLCKKTTSYGFISVMTAWVVISFMQGWNDSIEASPWYGLRIFRFVAVLMFALVHFIELPLKHGGFLLYVLINNIVFFAPFALLHSVFLSDKAEKKMHKARNSSPEETVFLSAIFISLLWVMMAFYLSKSSGLWLVGYVLSNSLAGSVVLTAALLWVSRNVWLSRFSYLSHCSWYDDEAEIDPSVAFDPNKIEALNKTAFPLTELDLTFFQRKAVDRLALQQCVICGDALDRTVHGYLVGRHRREEIPVRTQDGRDVVQVRIAAQGCYVPFCQACTKKHQVMRHVLMGMGVSLMVLALAAWIFIKKVHGDMAAPFLVIGLTLVSWSMLMRERFDQRLSEFVVSPSAKYPLPGCPIEDYPTVASMTELRAARDAQLNRQIPDFPVDGRQ